jgi:uncharacterized protein YqjF (DUF2071 family)
MPSEKYRYIIHWFNKYFVEPKHGKKLWDTAMYKALPLRNVTIQNGLKKLINTCGHKQE